MMRLFFSVARTLSVKALTVGRSPPSHAASPVIVPVLCYNKPIFLTVMLHGSYRHSTGTPRTPTPLSCLISTNHPSPSPPEESPIPMICGGVSPYHKQSIIPPTTGTYLISIPLPIHNSPFSHPSWSSQTFALQTHIRHRYYAGL